MVIFTFPTTLLSLNHQLNSVLQFRRVSLEFVFVCRIQFVIICRCTTCSSAWSLRWATARVSLIGRSTAAMMRVRQRLSSRSRRTTAASSQVRVVYCCMPGKPTLDSLLPSNRQHLYHVPKKGRHQTHGSNSDTLSLLNRFLKIPPHLKCVATLPWES